MVKGNVLAFQTNEPQMDKPLSKTVVLLQQSESGGPMAEAVLESKEVVQR